MKNRLLFTIAFLAIILAYSCRNADNSSNIQKSIDEIKQTEKDFETMAASKGVAEAFYTFADENAVIRDNDTICKGKANIRKHYEGWKYKDVSLTWSPDFVTVANSCDLGYSYGKYYFTGKDSSGKTIIAKGYFHTVWKKQPDGKWKFVWD